MIPLRRRTLRPPPMSDRDAPATRFRPLTNALVLFGAALLIRVVYLVSIEPTACLAINLDPISDMETFHRWAISIADGDWAGKSDFHPFHPWQEAVAPKEQWDRWYGRVFHQEPLYPYLLAAIYMVAPRRPESMVLIQLLLGGAGCGLIYLAARRLAPEGAALAAGGLSVFYGPYLYYESLLLRDTVLIPLSAAILWTIAEARFRRESRSSGCWWMAAGLLCGLAFVTKASILPFVLLMLVLAVGEGRAATARFVPASALLLTAGFVLPIVPLAARNIVVGAPALKSTTRGPIELINGNNPWHPGIGWFDGDDQRVGAFARRVMAEADGRLLGTAGILLREWRENLPGLAWLQVKKLGYFFAPFEMPNNASFSYFRLNSAVLRLATISFFWVSPLALVGLIASWELRRAFLPVYLLLVSGVAVTVAFYVIARFRAPLMPGILILAGVGLWAILSSVRARRWKRAAGLVALAAIVLVLNAANDYQDPELVRPQDHLIAVEAYLARGEPQRALREAEEARGRFPRFAGFHRSAGMIELSLGRPREALAALRVALDLDPSDAEVRRTIRSLEAGESP